MSSPSNRCGSCEAELTEGARFCNHCGSGVAGSGPAADDPTGEIPLAADEAPTEILEIDFEALAATRLMESIDDDQLERTARLLTTDEPGIDTPLVWADGDRPFDDTIDDTPVSGIAIDPDATTSIIDRVTEPDATPVRPIAAPPVAREPIFRPTVMTAIGMMSVVVLLIGLTADLIAISTTANSSMAEIAQSIGLRTGIWHLDDLASNLSIAGLIALVGLTVGSVAAALGQRWGAGLIGGSGLATAGLAGLALGLVEFPIRVATDFASVGSAEPFTVTITRDLGYWAFIAAGGVGIIAFFASINDMVIDRVNDLNPLVAAVGAVAAMAAAAGPMVPIDGAIWSVNWIISDDAGSWPTALLIGRAVQLLGLGIGGILGFLCVRRFGLGMVAGVLAPAMWMALTAWIGLGSAPIGPGHRNPGGGSHEVTGLTVVGLVATATLLAIAGAIAWDRSQHAPIDASAIN